MKLLVMTFSPLPSYLVPRPYSQTPSTYVPKLCLLVLITLRIALGKPLFAAIINHPVLACS
jgi:hypothetical protein